MSAVRYVPFVGRLLIGLPFAMSGLSKLAAIGPTTEMIRAASLPLPPLALALSVVVELGGGLLLVAGFQARIVAAVLALFSLATAVSFHSSFADQNLLQIVAFGAGALSIDNRNAKVALQIS
jgi:putative oxidoreductase